MGRVFLANFDYHTNVVWWIPAGASALALLIAILTVVYQALKAATTNPADALRYE
jgi:putative ABC transport system permease protein